MPLLVAIGLAFLAALPFTGLQPLWDTRHATSVLLSASVLLILLINSHFQDGGPESRKHAVLVYSRAIAAAMLTPLVILAAYGLKLRVDQYGWTPSRVVTAAIIVAVASHAVGYLLAVVRSPTGLAQLPITNVASAFVIVAMMLGLLSPLADPARLSVASQLQRLASGDVSPGRFDYAFLAKDSGRYGRDALERLKTDKSSATAEQISQRAIAAASGDRSKPAARAQPATPADKAAAIRVVHPAGQKLPAGFAEKEWSERGLPECLKSGTSSCQAVLVDLDGDGTAEVLLLDLGYSHRATAYKQEATGAWGLLGVIEGTICPGVVDALRLGHFIVAPAQTADIVVKGQRLHVTARCTDGSR
jgi:hypothetical protein